MSASCVSLLAFGPSSCGHRLTVYTDRASMMMVITWRWCVLARSYLRCEVVAFARVLCRGVKSNTRVPIELNGQS